MTTTVRGGRRRLLTLVSLSAPLWWFDGIPVYAAPPAVLQFAEQYQPKPVQIHDERPTPRVERGKLKRAKPERPPKKTAQKQPPRQEPETVKTSPQPVTLNNCHTSIAQKPLPLRQLWRTLRDTILATPDERTLQTKLRDLQTQLNEKNRRQQSLQASYAALKVALTHAEAERQRELAAAAATKQDNQRLQQRLSTLQATPTLDSSASQQAYAAGSAMGRDMISLMNERQTWGISIDRQLVLHGIIDSFLGHHRLSSAQLTTALADAEAQVNQAHASIIEKQQRISEQFLAKFSKQPDARQSPTGFWYRITYAGDSHLPDEGQVDVAVKESLTDGTVIQDMEVQGNVLSQPLSDYPPLFREALGYIGNHGAITLVVPPQLAYGESGSPPKVPPGATMVYELRIDGVRNHKTP